MLSKKTRIITLIALLSCTALTAFGFCVFGKMSLPLAIGFLVGALSAAAAHVLFFKASAAAPNGAKVAMFYMARLGVIIFPVIIALIISRPAALGVIIPHLFSIPIIAAAMALSKE